MNRILISLFALAIILFSCKAKRQIVELPKITTITIDRTLYDSIEIRDSILVPVLYCPDDSIPSDIPVQKEYHSKVKYKTTTKDSIVIDTIYVPKDVPYPVEKELSWLQQTQIRLCNFFLIGLVVFVGFNYRKKIFSLIVKYIIR